MIFWQTAGNNPKRARWLRISEEWSRFFYCHEQAFEKAQNASQQKGRVAAKGDPAVWTITLLHKNSISESLKSHLALPECPIFPRLQSSVSLAICYEIRYLATEVVLSGSISMSKGHIPWPPRGRAPVALGADVSSQNVDSKSTRSDAEWAPLFVLVARAVLFTGFSFSSAPGENHVSQMRIPRT